MNTEDLPVELKEQVDKAAALQLEVESKAKALKAAQTEIDATWDAVKEAMITNGIKSIKGDWGSLTIAEKIVWSVTNELPAKFYKKVPDTKKLTDTFKLEGKAPKGAFHSYTKYLTKRFK